MANVFSGSDFDPEWCACDGFLIRRTNRSPGAMAHLEDRHRFRWLPKVADAYVASHGSGDKHWRNRVLLCPYRYNPTVMRAQFLGLRTVRRTRDRAGQGAGLKRTGDDGARRSHILTRLSEPPVNTRSLSAQTLVMANVFVSDTTMSAVRNSRLVSQTCTAISKHVFRKQQGVPVP